MTFLPMQNSTAIHSDFLTLKIVIDFTPTFLHEQQQKFASLSDSFLYSWGAEASESNYTTSTMVIQQW